MVDNCFLDTETVGFTGPAVLIQYAINDGPINLHSIWYNPIFETLELIERICQMNVTGFNLAFDWFQINKIYNMLYAHGDGNAYPIDIVEELAINEANCRLGVCIKPRAACDLFLVARKGPYQATMEREDIRIKRVPAVLAEKLADELENRIPLNPIFFQRRKDHSRRKWQVYDINDMVTGEVIPDFQDVVLKFAPSAALKALASDALGADVTLIDEAGVEDKFNPVENGYAPFATSVGRPGSWNGAWPDVLRIHAMHWTYNDIARKYAADDVEYTRGLYKYFKCPEHGDDDSELACAVGAIRWRGYAVDIEKMKSLREVSEAESHSAPKDPQRARAYIEACLSPTERAVIQGSTKKVILEEIVKWGDHPASVRAREVLKARQAAKEVELYDKIILAGRFHASFKVIGALSGRMSGADGLNPQGIKKTDEVRSCFTLADGGLVFCGGDFSGFEVSIAEACYKDPNLRTDLLSGKKIHALFGVHVYPDLSYEQILATEGSEDDKYTKCKQAVFAMIYGGEGFTLQDRLGVELEVAEAAYRAFLARYPKIGEARAKVINDFCSMRQAGGVGTKVEWNTPADYISTMYDYRRYFTLENKVCKVLYELANDLPKEWRDLKLKVVRRERVQTAAGAVCSALYGGAFALQAANMRAAANHEIQGAGAQVTKRLQRKIWDIQPVGVTTWMVVPMNIHDEVLVPCHVSVVDKVGTVVKETIEYYKKDIPLIGMKWKTHVKNWSEA